MQTTALQRAACKMLADNLTNKQILQMKANFKVCARLQ
jgi:hypothetical protein